MPAAFRQKVLLIAALATASFSACTRQEPQPVHELAVAPTKSSAETAISPLNWRLADVRELETTVIWASHILIRHAESDQQVTGTVFDWRLDAPRPERSRVDALALANEIAAKLAAHPEAFEDLARRHSEDTTNAGLGGSLGGSRASDFRFEPEVLDALAALAPGQRSPVVETRHGFQIFRLRPAPDSGTVSGEHLVIGHESTSWLKNLGAPAAKRTRAEALSLAREIHAKLLSNPESFQDWIQRGSDHPDRVANGDIGTWSVREPTPHARAIEVLRGLPIGGISPPFETHCGIEIVRRTPDRERPLYAMTAIELAFAAGDPESKRATYELALQTIEVVKKDATRFDEFRRKYCCAEPERWLDGRAEPGLSRALAHLDLNEIASVPVERFGGWAIPKRIDPKEMAPALATKFQVPTPERPKLDWVLERLPARLLAKEIADVANEYPGLTASERQRQLLQEILRLASQPSESSNRDNEFTVRVHELFAGKDFIQYQTILEDRIGRKMLASTSVPQVR
jgi:hypothetical protein